MDNNKIVMDPKLYQEIGELRGKFESFEKAAMQDMAEIKQIVKSQSYVPSRVFDKYIEDTSKRIGHVEDAMRSIKTVLKIKENTITGRVATFLDKAIVQAIGGAIMVIVTVSVYLTSQSQIYALKSQIDVLKSQESKTNTIIHKSSVDEK